MKIAVPIWVLALLVLAILVLVLILWSVKRRRRPHLALEETGIDDLMASIAGVTQSTIVTGNRVELLQNGEMWDRLFEDMHAAKETINFETFLSKCGTLTGRMTDTLLKKQLEGVQVRMMLDGSGGRHYGKDDKKRLENAGVRIGAYHPITLSRLGVMNNRDHRKICVIDGRIGYVGGHCLCDEWMGNAEDKKHYRDITARVEGPVVAQLQSAFAENWIEETGEVIGGTNFFPELLRRGDVSAHAVWISPTGSASTVKLLHYMAVRAAKKSIHIQNPYFLPDPDMRKELVKSAQRGIDVRVMIPADTASDAPHVQHASHHHYGTLLKGGVKLYDYQKTLLHQKVIVVDGLWASVGSTNFDDRSFEINDEISLVIHDERLARELEETFERDLKDAKAVNLEEWKKRPVTHKMRDMIWFLFNEQM
jgi:cardiolipin synthase A/B